VAFVLTIVPFDEIAIDLRDRSEAGKFTGPHDALQGAGKNSCERQAARPFPQPSRTAFPPFSEGKSMRPVRCPVIVHAVSPCRAR
jgi:hypothetical protein